MKSNTLFGLILAGSLFAGAGAAAQRAIAATFSGGGWHGSSSSAHFSGGATSHSEAAPSRETGVTRSEPSIPIGSRVLRESATGPVAIPSVTSGRSAAAYRVQTAQGGLPLTTGQSRGHPVWDHNLDHFWHGHRYQWRNGSWAIIDDGEYPYLPYYYADEGTLTDAQADLSGAPPAAGDSVDAEVQAALAALGYFHGSINGIAGPMLVQAISNFQRDHGLVVTGAIDQGLVDLLMAPRR